MKIYKKLFLALITVLFSSSSFATLVMFNDRTTFNAQGTVAHTETFSNFSNTGFSQPSDPYSVGGVTYSSADNLILGGSGTGYTTNGTQMITNNYWNPLVGTLDSGYNMFGFDGGWSNQNDIGTVITIGTNLSSYIFNVDFSIASSTDFYGFVTGTSNEHVLSFNLSSNYEYALNSIDNVSVGTISSSSVPEPSVLTLMGLGILGFVAARRKTQK